VRDRTGIVSTYIATRCKPLLHALAMEQEKEACDEASWHAARMEQSQQLHMEHMKLLSDGARYASKEDWHNATRCCHEAITLRPDEPTGYYNLGATLGNSGRIVEAAQLFLEAKERFQDDSWNWAVATADAFETLRLKSCGEVAKPGWWNDEELLALSGRVVSAAPNDWAANSMRAHVLSGQSGAWEAGPRSAAELSEAAKHLEVERLRLACCC
jgi:tetratricopeptide (TPR) repeat protein